MARWRDFLALILLLSVTSVSLVSARRVLRRRLASMTKVIEAPVPASDNSKLFSPSVSIENAVKDENEEKAVTIVPREIKKRLGFPLVYATLYHYKLLFGNLLVPTSYVVPTGEYGWPEASWGVKLGSVVNNIRRGCHARKREHFTALGFCYNVFDEKFLRITQALIIFKRINGNMLVPRGMVVPSESNVWPENLAGLRLGAIVDSIRDGKIHTQHREELLEIGFDYSKQLKFRFGPIKLALLTYKGLYGDMNVNPLLEVPGDNDVWPKETWGIKLGMGVTFS